MRTIEQLKRKIHELRHTSQPPNKKKKKVAESATTTPNSHEGSTDKTEKLDPLKYNNWSKEQACSLLCTPEDKGGVGLTFNEVQPLYDAGFNGTAIGNIVNDIRKIEQHKDPVDECWKDFPNVPRGTIKYIVNWIDNQIVLKLCSIGITKENVRSLNLERFYFKEETNMDFKTKVERSTKILLQSFGSKFKFVERAETLDNIIKVFKKRPQQKSIDKKDVILPFIAAAPGVGKSKLLKEMALVVSKSSIRNQVPTIPLIISFGNGTSLRNLDENNVFQSLITRIIFSALIQRSGIEYNPALFDSFLKEWSQFSRNKNYNLKEAFIMVSYILGIDNKTVDFFLAFDEVQNIDSNSNSKLDNPLREIMSRIGTFISANESNHKLFVLFAGTYYTPIHDNLVGSTYTPHFFPLHSTLSEASIDLLLDDLISKYEALKYWRTNSVFRSYLRRFSGFPRGVETFIEDYIKTQRPLSAWESAKVFLKQKYISSLDDSITNYLAKCIFSKKSISYSTRIPNTDFTFSGLEHRGAIMINSEPLDQSKPIATYPIILLENYIPSNLKTTFESIYYNNNNNVYGFNWEDIIQNYHYLLLSLLQDEREMSLSNLFRFAIMNESTGSTRVLLSRDVKISNSNTQIHKDYNINTPLNLQDSFNNQTFKLNINKLNSCHIIKNATSAKSGDVLILGLKKDSDDRIPVIHLQGKWADSDHGSLAYSDILEELEKNNLFKFTNTNNSTHNITMVLTGKNIHGMPKKLPNDLIIVCKENFDHYFVNFYGLYTYLHASTTLHINECSKAQLENFQGIGKKIASSIIEKRPPEGFKTKNQITNLIGKKKLFDSFEIVF